MRKCHECNKDMNEVNLHGQTVDRCPECRGIFFDKGELESIIHIVDLFVNIPNNETEIDNVPEAEHERIVKCPNDETPLQPEEIAGLTIDICPECKGIWLDHGEISALKIAENHMKDNLQLYIRLGE